MRLQYLLEYTFPEIRYKTVTKLPKQYADVDLTQGLQKRPGVMRRNPKVQHLGTGYFSSVYGHEDRPQDVRKISSISGVKSVDGFFHYMIALSKHEDYANPYFPKVRSMTVYTNPTETQLMYSVQLERLFSGLTLNVEQLEAMTTKMFGRSFGSWKQTIEAVRWVLYSYSQDVSGWDLDLIRAIKFVKDVARKSNLSIDFHRDNALVRHTPYGPQFVFADPLSFPV